MSGLFRSYTLRTVNRTMSAPASTRKSRRIMAQRTAIIAAADAEEQRARDRTEQKRMAILDAQHHQEEDAVERAEQADAEAYHKGTDRSIFAGDDVPVLTGANWSQHTAPYALKAKVETITTDEKGTVWYNLVSNDPRGSKCGGKSGRAHTWCQSVKLRHIRKTESESKE